MIDYGLGGSRSRSVPLCSWCFSGRSWKSRSGSQRGLTYTSFVLYVIAGICAPIILALSFAGQAEPITDFIADWVYFECTVIVAIVGLIVAFYLP